MTDLQDASAMSRTRWFDRKFTRVDAGHLYWLIERLRGTAARLAERLAGLDVERLAERSGDSWSIQENVGHLGDLEGLWIGRVEDFATGAATLRAADLSNTVTHGADHNGSECGALIESFRTQRLTLVQKLEALPDDVVARTALHPRLETPMNVADLAFFVAEHDDHHMAMITDILRGR